MGSSVTSPPVAHPVSERPAGPALSLASQRYGSMRLWRTLTRVNVHHSTGVPHAPSLCAARCSRIAVTTSAAVVALTAVCATGDGSPTSSRVVGVHVHQCGCTVVVGLIDDATTVDGTGVSGVSVTAEGTIIRRALCKLAITTTQRGIQYCGSRCPVYLTYLAIVLPVVNTSKALLISSLGPSLMGYC